MPSDKTPHICIVGRSLDNSFYLMSVLVEAYKNKKQKMLKLSERGRGMDAIVYKQQQYVI